MTVWQNMTMLTIRASNDIYVLMLQDYKKCKCNAEIKFKTSLAAAAESSNFLDLLAGCSGVWSRSRDEWLDKDKVSVQELLPGANISNSGRKNKHSKR